VIPAYDSLVASFESIRRVRFGIPALRRQNLDLHSNLAIARLARTRSFVLGFVRVGLMTEGKTQAKREVALALALLS